MDRQNQLWNNIHKKGSLDEYSQEQTGFAQEVNNIIPQRSSILDLGCGAGNDSVYFAKQNHNVAATDFSSVAIEKNKQLYKNQINLKFIFQDINYKFNFDNNHFDVVYARLSLHYFTDKITNQIISEVYRVLKKDGFFCLLCKSVSDSLYGKGKKIEEDMYSLNGHVRHFFSEDYMRKEIDGKFKIKTLEHGSETFYNRKSAFIKVIAQKK